MTDFEKQIYTDMNSVDRCLLLIAKLEDFIEFSKLMTKEDIELFYVEQAKTIGTILNKENKYGINN